MHAKYLELGLESPFSDEWFKRPSQDDRITTAIDIDGFAEVRFDALLAHATQIDPKSPFWFGLPRDVAESIHPYDDYILAHEPRRRSRARGRPVRRARGKERTPADGGAPQPGVARPACASSSPSCPSVPGRQRALQHVVTGAPDGEVALHWTCSRTGDRRPRPSARSDDVDVHVHRDLRRCGARSPTGELDLHVGVHAGPGEVRRRHRLAHGGAAGHAERGAPRRDAPSRRADRDLSRRRRAPRRR